MGVDSAEPHTPSYRGGVALNADHDAPGRPCYLGLSIPSR
jgi:hypothetical protein